MTEREPETTLGAASATIRPAVALDVQDVIDVFHASRAAAMPWLPILHTPEEDQAFFRAQLAGGRAWVAEDQGELVGFAIASPGWLDHLYVRPDRRGTGVGSALLARALGDQPDGLDLWVFARNAPAREFYARRGFVDVLATDGEGNEEREPDVLMRWPPA
jgi:GNAT superfamily N-acetyltransferase